MQTRWYGRELGAPLDTRSVPLSVPATGHVFMSLCRSGGQTHIVLACGTSSVYCLTPTHDASHGVSDIASSRRATSISPSAVTTGSS